MQSAPGSLKTKLIEKVVVNDGGVLADDVPIARCLVGGAVPCVLAEGLVLGVHLDAGNGKG